MLQTTSAHRVRQSVTSGISGSSLPLNGGNDTVNFNNADFNQSGSGRVVSIINRTVAPANVVTFDSNSAVSPTAGTGVELNSNSQATIKFQGGGIYRPARARPSAPPAPRRSMPSAVAS